MPEAARTVSVTAGDTSRSAIVTGEERLALALEASGAGTWVWDMAAGTTRWDPRMEALHGLPAGSFGGTFDDWLEVLHPDERGRVLQQVSDALATRGGYELLHRTLWPDGSVHWIECRGRVTTDERGAPTGTVGVGFDVTARVESEAERARLLDIERTARERSEYLARVDEAVARARSVDEMVRAVASAAVPRLADWCAIVVSDGTNVLGHVAHADATREAWAKRLHRRFPYDADAPNGIPAVIRTGIAELSPHVAPDETGAGTTDPELWRILETLHVCSSIVVPLPGPAHPIGALQLVQAESGRHYTRADLDLAQDLAARVALSIETAQALEREQRVAETLQRSLLPTCLPDVPGAQVAVRYLPATEHADVGGDFYDLFQLGTEEWGLLVGDVSGKGVAAAALTGIARHTARAAARHGLPPAEVLTWVNDAFQSHTAQSGEYCTAIFGSLRAANGGFDFTFAVGGHPLPVVVRGGRADAVGEHGTALGLLDQVRSPESTVHLHPDDWLVLYSDGLTDLRGDAGLDSAALHELLQAELYGTAAEAADRVARFVRERAQHLEHVDDTVLAFVHALPRPHLGRFDR